MRRGKAFESMLRAARIASRRSPLCAAAPVRGYAVSCAGWRIRRATASYGEAGSQWRGRLVPRTPLARTVPAGAAKYAQRGTTGGFPALRNLLGFFLALRNLLGFLRAMSMGRPGRTAATYLEAIASALALSLARPSANVLAATNAPVFLLLLLLFR